MWMYKVNDVMDELEPPRSFTTISKGGLSYFSVVSYLLFNS